ncbi:MAG TPA: GDSL-type esterase/lipase family protein [Bacteroidia bacterium]|nr:hypothetical protein [Bacteroidia bacterium]MBP7713766.1 hypothetical protein [Bacteroidia bacterium]MBP8667974.1 hypothetical protein [Bacteroidia bacterium]HOZ81352.1 GDSL-type esterase/lipase family protein [Bacteroidia bacterium]HOZ89818.1 GDSL-type esterase/lipase family protein [Bacteroidia bacterium]
MKRIILIFSLLIYCTKCHAQSDSDTTMPVLQYEKFVEYKMSLLKFLKPDAIDIEQKEALKNFYSKLLQSRADGKKVSIVHIGDSHLQAGYFSGMVRRGLQQRYGNAGRGIVFPYKLARSNGPHDYVSFSQNSWKGNRNVITQDSLSTGITGFSVTTNDSSPSVGISLRNNEGIDYRFNRVQVFYKPDSTFMTASDSLAIIETVNPIKLATGINEFRFSDYLSNCKINISSDTTYTLFGLNLLNDSSGVVYHNIGVNGAEYKSFLGQPMFFEQVKELNADLYILSFGTNEAFAKYFDGTVFIQTVDSFITKLRNVSPTASILITSPTESCKRIRRGVYVPNPNVIAIKNLLQKYCMDNKIAFFDLYECSGGKGSMLRFAKNKMSDARRIHLNRSGYEMQGLMLLQALLKPLSEQ